jgi:drug/metabolite transporter (DMT)-like permease
MAATVVLCGVLSAALAGVADFFAALVSRKLGSFLTLLYMIAGSAVVLFAAQALWLRETGLTASDVAVLFLVAAAALVGYLAFYRALALGPVAVVSPIAACDGAIAALIGIGLLGERLGAAQWVAIVLLVAGVALAATNFRELRQGLAAPGRGPLLALVTMVCFGVALAGITSTAGRTGSALLPVLVLRGSILLQMTAAAGARREWYRPGVGLALVLAAVGVGLLDTGSLVALARGMVAQESGRVALLGPLYGAYPVVTVLLARVVLRERLVANQWAGIALAMAGTALMAV